MAKLKKVKSAKDILISTDFLEARQKAAKYVNHEFQDYGLRLAHDLGDPQHKAIYLKLAKTVDRTLLEQAAAFALGYFDEPNKGKIFMWKVQQLRRMAQQKLDMQNFEHEFVVAKMSELMNELEQVFKSRHKADFEKSTQELLQMIVELYASDTDTTPDKTKILLLGTGAGHEAAFLSRLGFKVFGLDTSVKLVKAAKKINSSAKIVKKKHFLENSYKDSYFNIVIVNSRFWSNVTLDSELDYLKEIYRLIKPTGQLYLGTEISDQDSQNWHKFDWQEQQFIKFVKHNSLEQLTQRCKGLFTDVGMLAANYLSLKPE